MRGVGVIGGVVDVEVFDEVEVDASVDDGDVVVDGGDEVDLVNLSANAIRKAQRTDIIVVCLLVPPNLLIGNLLFPRA